MRKFPVGPAQALLAATLLLASPLAHAQDGGKMSHDKMAKSDKMSDSKQ